MTKMTVKVANATVFKTSKDVVKALNDLDNISRFLKLQLVEKGYVEIFKVKATAGRGRANHVYQISGKGRGLLALSSKWA